MSKVKRRDFGPPLQLPLVSSASPDQNGTH